MVGKRYFTMDSISNSSSDAYERKRWRKRMRAMTSIEELGPSLTSSKMLPIIGCTLLKFIARDGETMTPLQNSTPDDNAFLTDEPTAKFLGLAPCSLRIARVTGSPGFPFTKLTARRHNEIRYRKSAAIAWAERRTFHNSRQATTRHAARTAEYETAVCGAVSTNDLGKVK